MVGKNELVLIPKEQKKTSTENQNEEKPSNLRILTEDEFEELLSFDIDSFKFHDKLRESHEYGGGKEGSSQPNQQETPGIAKAPNEPEAEKKFSSSKTITIQKDGFKPIIVRRAEQNERVHPSRMSPFSLE
jgi:hypothetical protein